MKSLQVFHLALDYCGQTSQTSEGHSLRPLIEDRNNGAGRVAVSEWNSQTVPGFMVFDGRWKFMCGRSASARSLDALYDLQADPNELNNLIGRNPDRERSRAEAERMKASLIQWLASVNSPHLEAVKVRPVFGRRD